MAIIGWRRCGWSKKNPNHFLLIQFDTEEERNKFEDVLEKLQELIDFEQIK